MKKIFIMVMVLILALGTVVFAEPSMPNANASVGIGNIGDIIVTLLTTVAYVVAIAVLMFVGIKFMLASPAEKANIKGMLIPYIIGAVLIFGAATFVNIVKGWGTAVSVSKVDVNNNQTVLVAYEK